MRTRLLLSPLLCGLLLCYCVCLILHMSTGFGTDAYCCNAVPSFPEHTYLLRSSPMPHMRKLKVEYMPSCLRLCPRVCRKSCYQCCLNTGTRFSLFVCSKPPITPEDQILSRANGCYPTYLTSRCTLGQLLGQEYSVLYHIYTWYIKTL